MLQRMLMTAVELFFTLSTQLLVGGLLWSAFARSPGARRAARSLRGAAIAAGLAALVSFAYRWMVATSLAGMFEPVRLAVPGLFTIVGSIATSGCYLVLHAARLEARGRLRPARLQVRVGGKSAFLAIDLLLVLMLLSLILGWISRRETIVPAGTLGVVMSVAGAILLGAAGLIALLAGLSAKPRPSGTFAAALYVGGLALLVAAADPR